MKTRLNRIFTGIKQRCLNKKNPFYKDYGGRGITICKEWADTENIGHGNGFVTKGWDNFRRWALENGYQDNLSIDRVDNNKGYCPENCRWVDIKTQSNNKRSNIIIRYNEQEKTLSQWAESLGVPYKRLQERFYRCKGDVDYVFSNKRLKNKKSQKIIITYKDKTQTLANWCRELDLNYSKTRGRIVNGWSIEKAFENK